MNSQAEPWSSSKEERVWFLSWKHFLSRPNVARISWNFEWFQFFILVGPGGNRELVKDLPCIPVWEPLSTAYHWRHDIVLMEHPRRPHLEQSYTASRWLPHTEPQFPLCTSFLQQGYIDSRQCCYTLGRIQLSIPPHEQSQWRFLERWHTSAQGCCNIAHLELCYIASLCPTRKRDFIEFLDGTTTLGPREGGGGKSQTLKT